MQVKVRHSCCYRPVHIRETDIHIGLVPARDHCVGWRSAYSIDAEEARSRRSSRWDESTKRNRGSETVHVCHKVLNRRLDIYIKSRNHWNEIGWQNRKFISVCVLHVTVQQKDQISVFCKINNYVQIENEIRDREGRYFELSVLVVLTHGREKWVTRFMILKNKM